MKLTPSILALAASLATSVATLPALANDGGLDQAILDIQHQWERINYMLPAGEKVSAYEALERSEAALEGEYPGRPEPMIWHGITLSSHAGAKGGLGALGLAKEARRELQAAERIDPNAMQGSIYTSLGTLYYKVPGWPIGFGDDDKAEAYLQKALRLNPNGIDPNYFYADFLYGKHRYREAMQALEKALAAPARPLRPLADSGRREEIRALMDKVRTDGGGALKSTER
jgi:tetratricopeptide (TPR) repeat protein